MHNTECSKVMTLIGQTLWHWLGDKDATRRTRGRKPDIQMITPKDALLWKGGCTLTFDSKVTLLVLLLICSSSILLLRVGKGRWFVFRNKWMKGMTDYCFKKRVKGRQVKRWARKKKKKTWNRAFRTERYKFVSTDVKRRRLSWNKAFLFSILQLSSCHESWI